MGYGEYLGGGSVHWRVVHEEYEDTDAASAPTAGRGRKRRTARARLRTENVPPDVPAQHVANLDVLDYEARGIDTVTFGQIGKCNGSKDHEGRFRVQMRFQTLKEARAAAKAAQKITRFEDMYVVTVDVPVIERTDEQVGPPPDPPSEVRVDW